MLRFEIKGSARAPYRVTFEGSGPSLKAYCSCPAGSRGGKFCKHVAALLNGEYQSVVSGGDLLPELKRLAEGSDLVSRAINHQPAKPKPSFGPPRFVSLCQVEQTYGPALRAIGCDVEVVSDDDGLEELRVYTVGKRGSLLKHPKIRLSFEPFSDERLTSTLSYSIELGHLVETVSQVVERPASTRPWRLSAPGCVKSWSSLDRAIPDFEAAIAAI